MVTLHVANNPLVSIIIPYYDYCDYLLDAVNSAAAQEYPEVEIIVVDDCSPVAPASEILKSHPFKRLTIVRHEENLGCATARNTGIKKSVGEYILPLDSDDMISPEFITATLPILLDRQEIGCVYTQCKRFGEIDLLWVPEVTLLNVITAQPGPPTFLYRREVWQSVNGYRDGFYHADAAFWVSLLQKGWKIQRVEESLYFYRRHPRNGSSERLLDEVPSLSREFRDLFIENLEPILAKEEEKYWQLKEEYKILEDGFRQLEEGYLRVHKELDGLLEARSKSLPERAARFIRNLLSDGSKSNGNAHNRHVRKWTARNSKEIRSTPIEDTAQ